MAVVLNRRGNIKKDQSEVNIKKRNRKIRMKTHPQVRKQLEEVKKSIERASKPEKIVVIRSPKDLPRKASKEAKKVLKESPKNINPETNRKRNWTYKKYPSIMPPPQFIRKPYRAPKAALVGNMRVEREV